MTDKVLYAADGPIVTITLNDPAMRNPISEIEMVDGIVNALERLNRDTGGSGGDPDRRRQRVFLGRRSAEDAGRVRTRAEKPHLTPLYYKHGIQRIPLAFEKLDVPIIAAVNGPAIGAGLDLACMCDMRIAAETARFAESFVKVGIVPGDGGAWLLPRTVGYAKACEMAFTGDMLTAAEALACGWFRAGRAGCGIVAGGEGSGGAHRGQSAARGAHGQAAADGGTAYAARYAAGNVGGDSGADARDPGSSRGGERVPGKASAGVQGGLSGARRSFCWRRYPALVSAASSCSRQSAKAGALSNRR